MRRAHDPIGVRKEAGAGEATAAADFARQEAEGGPEEADWGAQVSTNSSWPFKLDLNQHERVFFLNISISKITFIEYFFLLLTFGVITDEKTFFPIVITRWN